jgi:rhodanese-related sulfurtransferase
MPIKSLTVTELKIKMDGHEPLFLLDVREPFEYHHAKIAGSILIPLNQIPQRLQELDETKEIVIICHHGMRSMQAANFLDRAGFKWISNLMGGIDAWSVECDNSVARY